MFVYHTPASRWSGASLGAAATSNCPILPLSGTRASHYAERRSGEGRVDLGFMPYLCPHTLSNQGKTCQLMVNSG